MSSSSYIQWMNNSSKFKYFVIFKMPDLNVEDTIKLRKQCCRIAKLMWCVHIQVNTGIFQSTFISAIRFKSAELILIAYTNALWKFSCLTRQLTISRDEVSIVILVGLVFFLLFTGRNCSTEWHWHEVKAVDSLFE